MSHSSAKGFLGRAIQYTHNLYTEVSATCFCLQLCLEAENVAIPFYIHNFLTCIACITIKYQKDWYLEARLLIMRLRSIVQSHDYWAMDINIKPVVCLIVFIPFRTIMNSNITHDISLVSSTSTSGPITSTSTSTWHASTSTVLSQF